MSTVAFAAAAGAVLGVLFFGGLWWTVQRGLTATAPGLWFLLSTLARVGAVLLGFQLVAQGSAINLLACLAGFVLARIAVTRLTRGIQHAR
jgi:F1F0 ATPase subunit 2